jgi:hypothetical protein
MDGSIFLFKDVPLFATPVVVGLGWWTWSRTGDVERTRWRATALFVAALAATANAGLFYLWVAYRLLAGPTQKVWAVQDFLADNIALYLVLVALLGTLAGTGRGRILIALSALMGFMLWVPVPML